MKLNWNVSTILILTLMTAAPAVARAAGFYSTALGAPVNSMAICEKNLAIIADASVEDGEKVLESACKSLRILNTDSGDVEVKYQPSVLLEK